MKSMGELFVIPKTEKLASDKGIIGRERSHVAGNSKLGSRGQLIIRLGSADHIRKLKGHLPGRCCSESVLFMQWAFFAPTGPARSKCQ